MPLGDLEFASGGFEFGDDFWGGGAQASSDVPGRYPAALAGIGFVLDVVKLKGGTIPSQRGSTDTSAEPSEAALNPEGIWPRQQTDWSLGEGQVFMDRPTDPERRRSFKIRGAEWTSKDAIAVGQRFELQEAAAGAGQLFLKAGTWYYWYNGTTLKMTQTPTAAFSAWTTATTFTGTPQALAHDGTRIYLATSAGLFTAALGTAAIAATAVVTNVDNVAYVQNHLVIGQANVLKELDAAFAPTTISTHYSTGFRWTVIAGGNGAIFAGGTIGGVSELYVLSVSQSTGALQKSIAAVTLLPDEVLYTVLVYGQKAIMGTSAGVRVGDIVSMGGINYGAPVGSGACRALAGYNQFIYFGATNVDGISSGLGRLDLSTAVDAEGNQFAYAVDACPLGASGLSPTTVLALGVDVTGDVFGIIATKGIYRKPANLSGSWVSGVATFETGWIAYNTIERKTLVDLDVGIVVANVNDSALVELSIDGTTWTAIGTVTTGVLPPFFVSVPQARRFKLRFTLTAGAGRPNTLAFPTMSYWSIRTMPAPRRSRQLRLPLLVATQVDAGGGGGQAVGYPNPQAIFDYLFGYASTGELVSLQLGQSSYLCKIDDLEFEPVSWADRFAGFDGIIYATVTIP